MKKFNKRIRLNGQTSLIHTRADLNELMKFCNMLAQIVDELIDENIKLSCALEKSQEAIEEWNRRANDDRTH